MSAANPPSNLETVLARAGRASTPPVPATSYGITRGQLLRITHTQKECEAIVVGPPPLVERLSRVARIAPGVPGVLTEQVLLPEVTTLVIDWRAFGSGPWLGANTHAALALTDELFEAGRLMRAAGRQVLGIPVSPLRSSGDARLLSTCTLDLTAVPPVDLEEGAPQSSLWDALRSNRGNATEESR